MPPRGPSGSGPRRVGLLDAGTAVGHAVGVSSCDGVVGRGGEFSVAAEAVRELGDGRASALVVVGEPGIGKSRLVQAVEEDARGRDVTVLHAQAHPFERTRPFGLVATALDLRRRSPDPRRADVAALLAGEAAGPAEATGGLQYRVVEEVVDLVETACVEHPVLLVAEDIHWADEASLSVISSLVRRLPLSALLVVVTVRPAPQSSGVARLLDDLSGAGARILRLHPLEPEEVVALAARELGGQPGPTLTGLLAKQWGNPMWATALVRSLEDEGMLHRTGDGSR